MIVYAIERVMVINDKSIRTKVDYHSLYSSYKSCMEQCELLNKKQFPALPTFNVRFYFKPCELEVIE